jgi:hypothetical protein
MGGTIAAILGVAISSLASSCSAFGNVLLRWSHINNASLPEAEQRAAPKRCHIYPIICLYILNGLLDMVAFSLAPMSLLAPTSALTIVINAFAARTILGEVMTSVDMVGAGVVIVGATVCTIFGSKESEQRTADELADLFSRGPFITFVIIDACLLALCMLLSLVVFPRVLGVSGLCYSLPALRLSPDAQAKREAEAKTQRTLSNVEKEAAQEAKKQAHEKETRERRKSQPLNFAIWAFSFATLVAGVASWTNILLKSSIEMTVVSHRNGLFNGRDNGRDNQMVRGDYWLIVSGLAICACMQGVPLALAQYGLLGHSLP